MYVLFVEFLIVPHTRVTQQVWVVLVEAIAQSSAGAVLCYCVSHKHLCCYEAFYQVLIVDNALKINQYNNCCVT